MKYFFDKWCRIWRKYLVKMLGVKTQEIISPHYACTVLWRYLHAFKVCFIFCNEQFIKNITNWASRKLSQFEFCACFFFQLASYDILANMTGRNISDYLMKTNYEFYKRRFGGKVSLYGVESIWHFLHGFSLSIKNRPRLY